MKTRENSNRRNWVWNYTWELCLFSQFSNKSKTVQKISSIKMEENK